MNSTKSVTKSTKLDEGYLPNVISPKKYFLKFIIYLSVLLIAVTISAPTFAQTSSDRQYTEIDKGWCPSGQPSESDCKFASADEACAFATDDIYNGKRFVHGGAEVTSDRSAKCTLAETTGAALYIGTPIASRKCSDKGRLSGTVCTTTYNQINVDKGLCPAETMGSKVNRGNPIDLASGRKHQEFIDFQTADGRLKLSRFYMSNGFGDSGDFSSDIAARNLGQNWGISSHPTVRLIGRNVAEPSTIHVYMPEGVAFDFRRRDDGTYVFSSLFNIHRTYGGLTLGSEGVFLEIIDDKIEIRRRGGRIYTYSLDPAYPRFGGASNHNLNSDTLPLARLEKVEFEGGYAQTFTYNGLDEIDTMVDNLGRKIEFKRETRQWFDPITNRPVIARGGNARTSYRTPITKIILPDESTIEYEYYNALGPFNEHNNVPNVLKRAIRKSKGEITLFDETYVYEDPRFPENLTGIIDSAGIRYASWKYDEDARAIESVHALGVDEYKIERFKTSLNADFTVTNPLGKQTKYNASGIGGIGPFRRIEGQPSENCGGDISTIAYDSKKLEKTLTDREGRKTYVKFDELDRVIEKTLALGLPEESTVTTTWHPKYWRVLERVTGNLTTNYSVDDKGRVLSMSQVDTVGNGGTRTWQYTYDGPNITSIDGPLPGTEDTQYFEYDGPNLQTVTNELGHVTQITDHNPIGAPKSFVDPNGIVTNLSYDSKHRLTQIIEAVGSENAITSITYSAVDLVTSITSPNGSSLIFNYDAARRLMGIENSMGETIEYTRNNMGGITSTRISKGLGGADYILEQVIDEKNRIISAIGAGASSGGIATTKFEYDDENNLTTITDPRNNSWTKSYDGLNRLVKDIDPIGAETDYTLDARIDGTNPLGNVKDARNVITNYIRNGFGELIREVSFENGTTEYVRDARGLVTQKTDGRGIVTQYTYDMSGRLLSEIYPSEPQSNITYTYDEGANGIGQLTTVTESFGPTTYAYNTLGQMIKKVRVIGEENYTTRYSYDLAGEVLSVTYPSGREVRFQRDLAARITHIHTRSALDSEWTMIAENIGYAAFGPLKTADFGDGHTLTLDYDTGYKAQGLSRFGPNGFLMDYGFEFDAAGDILAINDNVSPERSQRFTYDPVSRLTSAKGGYGALDYSYNLGGDRLTRQLTRENTDGSTQIQSDIYNYSPTTAQLQTVSRDQTLLRDFDYTASGQILSDTRISGDVTAAFTFENDARGRLSRVIKDGTPVARYTYDRGEQRIVKALEGGLTLHYHYDRQGRLLSETDGATGKILRDYIWLGLTPIAVIQTGMEGVELSDCDENEITRLESELAELMVEISTAIEEIQNLETQIVTFDRDIDLIKVKVTELEAALAEAKTAKKQKQLKRKLKRNRKQITNKTRTRKRFVSQLSTLTSTMSGFEDQQAELETQLEQAQAKCESTVDMEDTLSYLHADHLGRPQFATDRTGAIVWDGGVTTPFGVSVSTMGAFTQNLMFPGQYQDAETTGADVTLSHNWHRTYDPTLGRYLQSDPIGLAGGLNRYAYGYSNPVYNIDPTGEIVPILIGMAIGISVDFILDEIEGEICGCEDNFPDTETVLMGAIGAGIGLFGNFETKPRIGFGGGGASGDRTSLFSRTLHSARNRGLISQKSTRRLRIFGRRMIRGGIPFVGVLNGIDRANRVIRCLQ